MDGSLEGTLLGSIDGSMDGFTSACKSLEIADSFSDMVGAAVSFTFFGVVKPQVETNGQNEFLGVSSLAFGFSHSGTTAGASVWFGDLGAPSLGYSSDMTAVGSYRVVSMTMAANTVTKIRQAGAAGTLAGTLDTGTITDYSENVRIGANHQNDCFKGDIAELVMYNRVLTTSEIAAIEAKLSSRFGL